MVHEYFKEMLASYALSALDGADQQALEEHLPTCESCREELDKWHSTAAALAFAGKAVEPSPDLRERILVQVKKEREASAASEGLGRFVATDRVPKVFPVESKRRNIWSSVGSLGAIAAAIAVVALIIALIALWRENRATKSELARLSNQVQAAEAQLATERETVQLLGTPGAHMVELTGTNVAPGAHAMLAYDKNGRAMLLARGLPATPAGKAYQLWFIVGKQKVPGGVFTTDTSGNGNLKDEIPAIAQGAPIFAVTLEPAGGVNSPTGAIFLISGS